MMYSKSILILAAMTFSFSGFAAQAELVDMLNIGDRAIFVTKGATPGLPSSYDNCRITENIISYTPGEKTYEQASEIVCPNASDHHVEYGNQTEALTPKRIDEILGNCESQWNGRLEKVTVPAGTFDTCVIGLDNGGASGIRWIGRVPMGNVKVISNVQGSNFTMELEAFIWGK